MHELIVVDFHSRELQLKWCRESRVREYLRKFLETGSFESAQKLCCNAIPTSEFYSSQCLPDGTWIATIRFDNLLHEGGGPTEAAALIDAITRISEVIDSRPRDD